MQPSAVTVRKLGRLGAQLRNEFSHLPGEVVDAELRVAAEELLRGARFDDFVPLLAGRRVRERLDLASAA